MTTLYVIGATTTHAIPEIRVVATRVADLHAPAIGLLRKHRLLTTADATVHYAGPGLFTITQIDGHHLRSITVTYRKDQP